MPKFKDRYIHCRVDEEDFERFHANAETLDMTPSGYIRFLIRIPVDECGIDVDGSIVTIDSEAISKVHGELVRWGYHYNQAVHALNTVALFINRGGSNIEYFCEQFDKANRFLEQAETGRCEILEEVHRLESSTLIRG